MSEKSIERELAEKWMKSAVERGDQAKALYDHLVRWQEHFLDYGNHKFDCAGNDGSQCECGYLQLLEEARRSDQRPIYPGVTPDEARQ